eukprot:6194734-Pleurochrysis_carterae.AAC.1
MSSRCAELGLGRREVRQPLNSGGVGHRAYRVGHQLANARNVACRFVTARIVRLRRERSNAIARKRQAILPICQPLCPPPPQNGKHGCELVSSDLRGHHTPNLRVTRADCVAAACRSAN